MENVNEKLRSRFITISLIIISVLLFTAGFIIGNLTK